MAIHEVITVIQILFAAVCANAPNKTIETYSGAMVFVLLAVQLLIKLMV